MWGMVRPAKRRVWLVQTVTGSRANEAVHPIRHVSGPGWTGALCRAPALRPATNDGARTSGASQPARFGRCADSLRVSSSGSSLANLGAEPELLGFVASDSDRFYGQQSVARAVGGDPSRALHGSKNHLRTRP